MKQLQELLQAKAKIEAQIRQLRVIAIRKHHAKSTSSTQELDHLIAEMERRLQMVVYCHQEFDELLEQIETLLDL